VLIAVNPFKQVPRLYTPAVLQHYMSRKSTEHNDGYEPHIFLTADKVCT
jgi:myosin heavy subunit